MSVGTKNTRGAKLASVAAIASALGFSSQASAAQGGFTQANQIEGVDRVKALSDGSVELILSNGDVVKVDADQVEIRDGQIFVADQALEALAANGSFSNFIANNPVLSGVIGAGVVGGIVAAATSGGGGDDDDAPAVIIEDEVEVEDDVVAATAGDDVLLGDDAANTIDGLAGNDQISGLGGDDVLSGGDGNDALDGGLGADNLQGGADNDLLTTDALDTIDGGTGIDTADFSAATEGVIVDLDVDSAGAAGTPSQDGGVLNAPPGAVAVAGVVPEENILNEVDDVENLIGSDFNDGLFGNNEVNVLQGSAGDDLIHGFAGDDFLDGGEGTDTALFSAAPQGVTVNLADQVSAEEFAAIAAGDSPATFAATGGAGSNVLAGFENVVGSQNDDTITGDASANTLSGNAGNDELSGGAGNDTLNGGDGDDTILGGGGTDQIDGGAGIDTNSFANINATAADASIAGVNVVVNADGSGTAEYIAGGVAGNPVINESFAGIENITGTNNDDTIVATGSADNVLSGGAGNDTLTGGAGNDVLDGGDGVDTVDFSDLDVPVTVTLDAQGNGTAMRETGFSVTVTDQPLASLTTAQSPADLVAEAVAGNLYYNVHTNDFNGGEIRGQLLLDTDVTDADGVRTITLNASLDAAQEPGPTSDSAATGSGTVVITVAADGSVSYSSELSIEGLATSDLLPVAGVSSIHLHNAPAGENGPVITDIVQDAGGDVNGVALSADADSGDGDVFDEVIETDQLISIENVIGSNDGDLIIGSGGAANSFFGLDGDDTILGGGGTDQIDGGAGIDTNSFANINATAADASIAGVNVVVNADGSGTAEYIAGGVAGNPVINESFAGIENITGTNNDDTIVATGSADNVLSGGAGNDTLTGGAGNDVLDGGDGVDTVDFSDLDVPVTVTLDAQGNGTAMRETGFSVTVTDQPLASLTTAQSPADLVAEAVAGNLYYNVHTNDFNGGEIRGQLLLDTDVTDADGVRTITLNASLDAAQEPGPTSDSAATGSGTVVITVAADGSVSYSSELSIEGLATSDLLPVAGVSSIHLHNAPAGENGPVITDIVQDAGGDVNGVALSADADSGDGDVFDEVIETDQLISIENVIGSDDGVTLNGFSLDVVSLTDGDSFGDTLIEFEDADDATAQQDDEDSLTIITDAEEPVAPASLFRSLESSSEPSGNEPSIDDQALALTSLTQFEEVL